MRKISHLAVHIRCHMRVARALICRARMSIVRRQTYLLRKNGCYHVRRGLPSMAATAAL